MWENRHIYSRALATMFNGAGITKLSQHVVTTNNDVIPILAQHIVIRQNDTGIPILLFCLQQYL